jgi:lipopolysaccharide transport system ATP-binding protein
MAHITAEHLSLDFLLLHGSARSLKKTVLAAASGRFGEDRRHRMVVRALRDVSFHLNAGDKLGLIGANGAGKTSLLRSLAGIYEPTQGRLAIDGSLSALLEPSMGMNLDLTGHENIMLRALYMGLDRVHAGRLEEDVQDFAELGDFIDLPIRFYSLGMLLRLGFALATSIRPQILLMDEVFLAGDAQFMAKAQSRLDNMVRGAEILVLSTHLLDIVRQWCTRVIWMDQGAVVADGAPDEVITRYLNRG